MRSSPTAVPAQKKAVSGVTRGRMGLAGFSLVAGVAGVAGTADAGGGRNFRMRKSIVATGSLSENQVLLVLTNQPSPRAVRLGPVTFRSLVRTVSCSPSLR